MNREPLLRSVMMLGCNCTALKHHPLRVLLSQLEGDADWPSQAQHAAVRSISYFSSMQRQDCGRSSGGSTRTAHKDLQTPKEEDLHAAPG